jgi:hypothetical protein
VRLAGLRLRERARRLKSSPNNQSGIEPIKGVLSTYCHHDKLSSNFQKERCTHSAATANSFFTLYKSIEESMLHFHK